MTDEITDPNNLKDFKTFVSELEQAYPGLAKQRVLREQKEVCEARQHEHLKSARGQPPARRLRFRE